MAGMLRVPRTRGAISGLLLVLLGIWGGLVIFVGPAVGYGYTPDRTWAYSSGRLYMVILPAVATLLGGLMVLLSANRATAISGAWLAALGGAWFAVGGPLASAWGSSSFAVGTPLGASVSQRAFEQVGIFTGLGVVIVFLAALSLGRFTVRGVREAATAEAAGYEAGRTGETERPVASTRDMPESEERHGAHAAPGEDTGTRPETR